MASRNVRTSAALLKRAGATRTCVPFSRKLTFIVGTPGGADPFERGGFGVDRLEGIYKEELSGLHKPLGPNRDIGLRAEGTFELSRITLVDTLNQ